MPAMYVCYPIHIIDLKRLFAVLTSKLVLHDCLRHMLNLQAGSTDADSLLVPCYYGQNTKL